MKMTQNVFEELSAIFWLGHFLKTFQVKAEKTLGPRVLYTSIFTPYSAFEFLFHYSVPVSPRSNGFYTTFGSLFVHDPKIV